MADAPEKDHEGNLAVVRYSRKTKEQYVMTELPVEGDGKPKATGWTAKYVEGKWIETLAKKKVAKKAKPKPKKEIVLINKNND